MWLLAKWFPIFTTNTIDETSILTPFENRQMNAFEQTYFDFDFNFFENFTVGHRLLHQKKIYHSTSYLRLSEKGADHVIAFKKDDLSYSFAIICYFIHISGVFLLAVKELQTQDIIISTIPGVMPTSFLSLKNKGAFSKFYFHVSLLEQIFFISVDQIISNCILMKNYHNNFVIVEYRHEAEHD